MKKQIKKRGTLKRKFSNLDLFLIFLSSVLFYIAGYFSIVFSQGLILISLILFLLTILDSLNEYKLIFDYLMSCKKFIYFIAVLFILSTIIGMIFPVFFIDIIEKILLEVMQKTQGLNAWQLINFIFQNNVLASFSSIFFGLALGIFPIFFTLSNGYILGVVANMAVNQAGFLIMWRLLPHGIFEVPAILISIGLGLRIGFYWDLFYEKDPLNVLKSRIINTIKTFVLVVIPLLIIAAIIEGFLIYFFS